MYEDVAQQVYCKRNGVRIHEFGLLKHPTVAHIGASPDGISELGVMLEIKCPYRRQITGEVPVQYYYQIQGQLEVCGLQECDYLELKLEESPRPDFYDTAGHTIFPERGVVAEFYDSEAGKTVYTYSGVDWPVSALQEFECKAVERDAAVKFHYWIQKYRDDPCLMEREIGVPPVSDKRKDKPVEYSFRETRPVQIVSECEKNGRYLNGDFVSLDDYENGFNFSKVIKAYEDYSTILNKYSLNKPTRVGLAFAFEVMFTLPTSSWEDYSWQNTGEIMSRLEEMHLLQMCSVDESIRVAHIVSYATSDSHPLETERWISPGTKIHLEMWGLFQRLGSRWIRVVMAARTIQRGWRARSKMPIAK
ncbi:hypothetical protein TSOC_011416 [Tetrabaena socialis]|uniref:YqaJ viral recombinase domain-containing protein n=1 Tax=Tetrabaena socialis TaxID=47790 RepID=A0A2J7ZQQ1_9CHLO|nr:hypothetical protein TSOC_011416 [Tetrabaena socialis]|eukprot:PNH02589.1 hypothetical protein TSOC_011416 [Tetrabaena socialis]